MLRIKEAYLKKIKYVYINDILYRINYDNFEAKKEDLSCKGCKYYINRKYTTKEAEIEYSEEYSNVTDEFVCDVLSNFGEVIELNEIDAKEKLLISLSKITKIKVYT